jgi:hypothetical protein
MILYKHGLYVVGQRLRKPEDAAHLTAGGEVVLAAERFVDAEALRGTSFVPPDGFKVESVMHGPGGIHVGDPEHAQPIVIEFSEARAAYVRGRCWHEREHLEELPDGRVRLTFPGVQLAPIVSWVLQWGPHARVVSPPELVALVVAEIEDAGRQYRPAI